MIDRDTLAGDMQQAFHHWSTKRGEVFEVMADIALAAIADETERLRAELAAEKERAWTVDAELLSLREELAAAGNQMVEYGDRRVSDETERCAKIAETFDPSSWYFGPQIAAAIRASNAAPPGEEDHTCPPGKPLHQDCFACEDAAPPHVEPSAAESEIKAAYKEGWDDREADLMIGIARIYPDRSATEARMVELARKCETYATTPEEFVAASRELRKLVIETFGPRPG